MNKTINPGRVQREICRNGINSEDKHRATPGNQDSQNIANEVSETRLTHTARTQFKYTPALSVEAAPIIFTSSTDDPSRNMGIWMRAPNAGGIITEV